MIGRSAVAVVYPRAVAEYAFTHDGTIEVFENQSGQIHAVTQTFIPRDVQGVTSSSVTSPASVESRSRFHTRALGSPDGGAGQHVCAVHQQAHVSAHLTFVSGFLTLGS